MLRAAVARGPSSASLAKQVMDAGGLVGDEIMIGIVDERLRRADAETRGYILDGFPRTVAQAEALDRITAERPIDVVIDLDVPRDIVLERISARRVCRDCGTNYTASGNERQPWICDVCGGDVMQRDDDTPDAVNRRLDLYEKPDRAADRVLREPVAHGGRRRVGDPDDVFARLTTRSTAPRSDRGGPAAAVDRAYALCQDRTTTAAVSPTGCAAGATIRRCLRRGVMSPTVSKPRGDAKRGAAKARVLSHSQQRLDLPRDCACSGASHLAVPR